MPHLEKKYPKIHKLFNEIQKVLPKTHLTDLEIFFKKFCLVCVICKQQRKKSYPFKEVFRAQKRGASPRNEPKLISALHKNVIHFFLELIIDGKGNCSINFF